MVVFWANRYTPQWRLAQPFGMRIILNSTVLNYKRIDNVQTRVCVILVVGIVGLGCVGCSGGSGPAISGSVKLSGKPLPGATVQFEGMDGQKFTGYAGSTDKDGKFVIETKSSTFAPGKYRVLINKYVDKSGKATNEEDLEQLKAAGLLRNIVPRRYNAPGESELFVDLKEGPNELQPFDLKS